MLGHNHYALPSYGYTKSNRRRYASHPSLSLTTKLRISKEDLEYLPSLNPPWGPPFQCTLERLTGDIELYHAAAIQQPRQDLVVFELFSLDSDISSGGIHTSPHQFLSLCRRATVQI